MYFLTYYCGTLFTTIFQTEGSHLPFSPYTHTKKSKKVPFEDYSKEVSPKGTNGLDFIVGERKIVNNWINCNCNQPKILLS